MQGPRSSIFKNDLNQIALLFDIELTLFSLGHILETYWWYLDAIMAICDVMIAMGTSQSGVRHTAVPADVLYKSKIPLCVSTRWRGD